MLRLPPHPGTVPAVVYGDCSAPASAGQRHDPGRRLRDREHDLGRTQGMQRSILLWDRPFATDAAACARKMRGRGKDYLYESRFEHGTDVS